MQSCRSDHYDNNNGGLEEFGLDLINLVGPFLHTILTFKLMQRRLAVFSARICYILYGGSVQLILFVCHVTILRSCLSLCRCLVCTEHFIGCFALVRMVRNIVAFVNSFHYKEVALTNLGSVFRVYSHPLCYLSAFIECHFYEPVKLFLKLAV